MASFSIAFSSKRSFLERGREGAHVCMSMWHVYMAAYVYVDASVQNDNLCVDGHS